MIAKIVTGASFGGCTAYAYGKDQAEVIATMASSPMTRRLLPNVLKSNPS